MTERCVVGFERGDNNETGGFDTGGLPGIFKRAEADLTVDRLSETDSLTGDARLSRGEFEALVDVVERAEYG